MEFSRLITGGCSHSSNDFGLSWPKYVGDYFNEHFTYAVTGGAVMSYVERIIHAVSLYPDSLVIVQLTYPERLTLGLSSLDGVQTLRNSNWFEDTAMIGFTYNHSKNYRNISKLFKDHYINEKVDPKTIEFFTKQVVLSNFTLSLTYQSILALISACQMHNCKLLMFTWEKPVDSYFTDRYAWIKDKADFIPGSATHFFKSNNIPILSDNYHYGSQAHKKLAQKYIMPHIADFLPPTSKAI